MHPTPLLIGLTGHKGAGKSTVAALLEDEYSFAQIAFADPLLAGVGALLADAGVDGAWTVERALKDQPTVIGQSYRKLACTVADALRLLDADIFVRIAALKLDQARLGGDSVVISDVRYPNEAAWLRAQGGVLVRLSRRIQPLPDHSSEAHWRTLPADHEIANTTSLATLGDQVDRLMHTLRARA